MKIDVALTPALFAQPEHAVAVVIDVLRATSSAAALLDRGVPAVYVTATLPDAVALRDSLGRALLCGERDGTAPPGFDHGNSPVEFATMALSTPLPPVVLDTTNGTAALLAARSAPVVLAGALVNGGAVVEAALREARASELDVVFVCAGAEGGTRFSLEDAYAAGVLVSRLSLEAERAGVAVELTDAAEAAVLVGRGFGWRAGQALRESAHGRHLTALGFGADIELCAVKDRFKVAPRLLTDGPPRLVAG